MLLSRSNLAVDSIDAVDRERLLSPWSVAALALAILLVLVLVFPKRNLVRQLMHVQKTDYLTAAYVGALLRTEPDNDPLRLLYARSQMDVGKRESAAAQISRLILSEDEEVRRMAWLLRLRLLELQAYDHRPDTPGRATGEAALRQALNQALKETWSSDQWVTLAQRAAALGDRDLSRRIFSRLTALGTASNPVALRHAARLALAGGDYRDAAQLHFLLRQVERDPLQRKAELLEGLRTLVAGQMLDEALHAARLQLGDLRDDPEVLTYLVKLARSANQPAEAERYVKMLLQLSLWRSWQQVLDQQPRLRRVSQQAPLVIERPFDEATYLLAYEVFLGNRNLKDALLVAQSAVRQRPQDLIWHRRLAQVAEWSAQPELALRHWRHLAGQGQTDAWIAVLRLAPGLNDDEALLAAWQHQAGSRSLTPAEWRLMADLFERVSRPADGVLYFERLYQQRKAPQLLEQAAYLAERAGHADVAIRVYRTLLAAGYQPGTQAARLAALYYGQGQFDEAYRVLESVKAGVAAEDTAYWQLLGELAWQKRDDAVARHAYARLMTGQFRRVDVERLSTILRETEPDLAAGVAMQGWKTLREPALLELALNLMIERRNWARLRQWLAELTPEDQNLVAKTPGLLAARAQIRQRSGDLAGAQRDYQRALQLAPEAMDLRSGYIWLLVEQRDASALKPVLAAWDRAAQGSPGAWAAFAAGYLGAGQPRQALQYLNRLMPSKQNDYLWLMTYADALNDAGQADLAWRVQRHVWFRWRMAPGSQAKQDGQAVSVPTATGAVAARSSEAPVVGAANSALSSDDERMIRVYQTRLALEMLPADAGRKILAGLLRQELGSSASEPRPGGEPDDDPARAALKEVALAAALSGEAYDLAKAWMLQRYAGKLARPVYAEMTLALEHNDLERVDALLARQADAVPINDRISAGVRTGRIRDAQTWGAAWLDHHDAADEVHPTWRDTVLSQANHVRARVSRGESGQVSWQGDVLGATFRLGDRSLLDVETTRQTLQMRNTEPGVQVPASRHGLKLSWQLGHGASRTIVAWSQHRQLARFQGWSLRHETDPNQRVSWFAHLASRQPSVDSEWLRVGGMQDQAALGMQWDISKREYLRIEVDRRRYRAQTGQLLGHATMLNWELGYRVRREYPDWNVRLTGQVIRSRESHFLNQLLTPVSPPGTDISAVPAKSHGIGIAAGFGAAYREEYVRGWRPFLDVSLGRNSPSGRTWNVDLGVAGSWLGADHWVLGWSRGLGKPAGTNRNGEAYFQYRYIY